MKLSVLARPCLDRRIPDQAALTRAVDAWLTQRNAATIKVNWQITTADARVKLCKLYPTLELR